MTGEPTADRANAYCERAIAFTCDGESLLGVLAAPDRPASTAVVIVVGGPQYRAGSHRQFVRLARELAAGGYATLRFDCRGMGDSSGALRPFDALGTDIAAAIDAVMADRPSVQHVVLWGLCDAASAALLYVDATHDRRVAGLCLANPWVRSQASHARTQVRHYYARRLLDRGFWRKLLSGRVARSAVAELWGHLRAASGSRADAARPPSYVQRMQRGWQAFDRPVLLLCSGVDYTAREFVEVVERDPGWRTILRRPSVQWVDLPGADHTFSAAADAREVHARTLAWLRRLPGDGAKRST